MGDRAKELRAALRAAILDLDAGVAERLARESLASGGDARETIDSVIKPTGGPAGAVAREAVGPDRHRRG